MVCGISSYSKHLVTCDKLNVMLINNNTTTYLVIILFVMINIISNWLLSKIHNQPNITFYMVEGVQ